MTIDCSAHQSGKTAQLSLRMEADAAICRPDFKTHLSKTETKTKSHSSKTKNETQGSRDEDFENWVSRPSLSLENSKSSRMSLNSGSNFVAALAIDLYFYCNQSFSIHQNFVLFTVNYSFLLSQKNYLCSLSP